MADSSASLPARNAGLAILFMGIAGALVAMTSILAKALGTGPDGLHPLQISAGRFVFAFLLMLGCVVLRADLRPSLQGVRWPIYGARVFCGWSGITTMFAAVSEMPVAEATAISFLSPPFTMLLAVVFLGESLTARKILAVALALVGAALLLRPGGDAIQAAALFALASAMFLAVEVVFIKMLSDTEPPVRILLVSNAMGSVIALIAASFVWLPPLAGQWPLLVALGCVMVIAQAFFIQSMKRAEASFVSPVFYTVLVFAALYDFALYGVVPDLIAILGAAFIVAGALVLAWAARRPE